MWLTAVHELALWQVRAELEDERQLRARLQHTIARLRHILTFQARAANENGPLNPSEPNPFVGAWYRKYWADQEIDKFPKGMHQVGEGWGGGGWAAKRSSGDGGAGAGRCKAGQLRDV